MMLNKVTNNLEQDGFKVIRTEKTYLCEVLGFPVELQNVDIYQDSGNKDIEIAGIDYKELKEKLRLDLIIGEKALTGAQFKFIRKSLNVTQKQLADMLGVTRTAIFKWEAQDDEPTKMQYTTEIVFRMRMLTQMGKSKSVGKRLCELPVRAFKKPTSTTAIYFRS